ncbi:MAG TPA: glycosyltransferase [Azonexus sp.]|nr:glycosyltransferase [Azonexus sp.]
MKPIRKLTLAIPNRDDYYLNIALGMMKAFARRDVECLIADEASQPEAFRRHLSENRPDAVFEINRTRHQSGDLIPGDIPHIAWLQDMRCHGRLHCADRHFGGSEIIYTLLHPENFGLDPADHPRAKWAVLQTGVDPDLFHPVETAREERQFALCGYLPQLVPAGFEDDVPFVAAQGKTLTLGEMRSCVLIENQTGIGKLNLPDVHRVILERINRTFGSELSLAQFHELFGQPDSFGGWPFLLYLDTELPRIPERTRLLDAAIRLGSLDIYGPPTWLTWPNYQPFYRRMLPWRSQLAEVYRSTRINLHNGAFGMHSRVLECMACGGVIAVNKTDFDDKGQDIRANFTEGRHYIQYDFDNVEEVLASHAARPQHLAEMGREAARAVKAGHLWTHRIDTILNDLAAL